MRDGLFCVFICLMLTACKNTSEQNVVSTVDKNEGVSVKFSLTDERAAVIINALTWYNKNDSIIDIVNCGIALPYQCGDSASEAAQHAEYPYYAINYQVLNKLTHNLSASGFYTSGFVNRVYAYYDTISKKWKEKPESSEFPSEELEDSPDFNNLPDMFSMDSLYRTQVIDIKNSSSNTALVTLKYPSPCNCIRYYAEKQVNGRWMIDSIYY